MGASITTRCGGPFDVGKFEKPQVNGLTLALRSCRAMTMRWIWLVPL